jgi:hypothetical protein
MMKMAVACLMMTMSSLPLRSTTNCWRRLGEGVRVVDWLSCPSCVCWYRCSVSGQGGGAVCLGRGVGPGQKGARWGFCRQAWMRHVLLLWSAAHADSSLTQWGATLAGCDILLCRMVCLHVVVCRRQQMADADAETRAMATNINLDGEAVQLAGEAVQGARRQCRDSDCGGSTRESTTSDCGGSTMGCSGSTESMFAVQGVGAAEQGTLQGVHGSVAVNLGIGRDDCARSASTRPWPHESAACWQRSHSHPTAFPHT